MLCRCKWNCLILISVDLTCWMSASTICRCLQCDLGYCFVFRSLRLDPCRNTAISSSAWRTLHIASLRHSRRHRVHGNFLFEHIFTCFFQNGWICHQSLCDSVNVPLEEFSLNMNMIKYFSRWDSILNHFLGRFVEWLWGYGLFERNQEWHWIICKFCTRLLI
jgi:hypothetical protein